MVLLLSQCHNVRPGYCAFHPVVVAVVVFPAVDVVVLFYAFGTLLDAAGCFLVGFGGIFANAVSVLVAAVG